jgi:hypothetical protein
MFRCFNLRHVSWHLSCDSPFHYSLYPINAWLLSKCPPTVLLPKLVQLATRYRRISSTIGAASLNVPKNNRTANSAYRLRIQVFWYMTPVGKVAADVPTDFRAFILHGRRQNLCKHSPCDIASRRQCHCREPEASQHSTPLLPATQVRSDRAALLVVVRRKTKHQGSRSINIMLLRTGVINYHSVTSADRKNGESLIDWDCQGSKTCLTVHSTAATRLYHLLWRQKLWVMPT